MKFIRIIIKLLQETGKQYTADRGSMLAAALAYYTLFSLAPLMVITIAIAQRAFDDYNVQLLLILRIRFLAGTEVSEFVRSLLEGFGTESTGLIASIASIGVMIFGASNVFRQLKRALNTVWGVKYEDISGIGHFLRMNLLSFGLVLLIGALLIIAIAMNALAALATSLLVFIIPSAPKISFVFEYAIPFIIIIFLIGLLYKIVPDVKLRWRDVWWGAVLTTLLTGIVLAGLRVYLQISSFGSAYGAAGSLVVLLFFVYYGAQIFVFGAEFTRVFSTHYGSRAEDASQTRQMLDQTIDQ